MKSLSTAGDTEKNLGVPVYQFREQLPALLSDAPYWIENKTYSPDEIAIGFHHRLVVIHPFPNGNGTHARLMANILAVKLGAKRFTWEGKDLVGAGEARHSNIQTTLNVYTQAVSEQKRDAHERIVTQLLVLQGGKRKQQQRRTERPKKLKAAGAGSL